MQVKRLSVRIKTTLTGGAVYVAITWASNKETSGGGNRYITEDKSCIGGRKGHPGGTTTCMQSRQQFGNLGLFIQVIATGWGFARPIKKPPPLLMRVSRLPVLSTVIVILLQLP